MASRKRTPKSEPAQVLKGWKAIGDYLGIGAASAQRWAKSGMPVKREGRFTVANPDDLRAWIGREAHMPAPAQVVTSDTDVSAALKQSLAAVKRKRR